MLTLFPWQRAQWQHVLSMQTQNRLPHALLLTGNNGLGLAQFAEHVAQYLLCLKPTEENTICGTCQSCQLFNAKNHPDFHFIEPEEAGKQIKVGQVREIIEFMSLKSFTAKNKIVTLCPAEAMNRSTANALLKTLEEPPEQSMLILISYHPERLPVTIRSRCQKISFEPAIDQEAIDWLDQQGIASDYSADLLLHLTNGSPLSVMDMLENDILDERENVVTDIESVLRNKANPVELAGRWESLGCDRVIIWLMRFCQDMVRLKLMYNEASITNLDLGDRLASIAQTMDLKRIVLIYSFLQVKYREASGQTNYNSLSLLEEIIIYWNNPEQVKQF